MASAYTRIVLQSPLFIILLVLCTTCGPVFGKFASEKISLAFVIDNTGSMGDDIEQVKSAANLIFRNVMSSSVSRIGNFILVTFNDPSISPALITTNEAEYMSALAAISVYGGDDCPEMAMSGIEEALLKSHPGSYIFVFTDASAKDYGKYTRIKSIAQKKLSQVVFVLTGLCGPTTDPAYLAYHDLARATSGQVFHLEKGEVNKILAYVAEIVKAPRGVILEKEFEPGYGKTFNYTTDEKTKDVLVAVSGVGPALEISETDGTKPTTSVLMKTADVLVVKVNNTEPGTFTATVGSGSKTKAVVTGATTFDFKHGFSSLKPASITDTKTRPIADKLLYLAIAADDPDNDVELKEVNILDASDNILQVLPLDKIDEDFYLTEKIKAPNQMFKILVKGITKSTKKPIKRLSRTPIEPQLLTDEGPPAVKAPVITSVGETLKKVDFGDALELRCKVEGYPKPRIIWIDEKSGATVSEMVEDVDFPYEYVSVLSIEAKTNTSYQCQAHNDYGDDKKAVSVEVMTKFVVVNISNDTGISFGDENSLNCLIDSNPPSTVTWYLNGAPLNDYEYEISSNGSVLTVISMHPKLEGQYTCEVRNEINRQLFAMQVTMSDKALPKIHDTVAEVDVRRNENADLNCTVTDGVPQPAVRWFFKPQGSPDFVEIKETLDIHHITNAALDNAGTYRCEAFNEYGKDVKTIVLSVEYPPTIKDDKKFMKIEKGKNVYLNCVVDGIPQPNVQWTFHGDVIKDSATHKIFPNNTLRFEAAVINDGSYICEAVNKQGSARKSVYVLVYVLPKIKIPEETTIRTPVGSSVTLNCDASGIPTPVIRWMFIKKGKTEELRPTDKSGSLSLPRLQTSESGYYVCSASNSGGSSNITYSVDVIVPPIITKLKNKKAITAVVGDLMLELPCRAHGNPKPTISWLRNGLYLSTGNDWYDMKDDGTLIIKNIDKSSHGSYVCLATNKGGNDMDVIHVNVLESPPPSKPKKVVDVEHGSSARINCDIPHMATDVLKWYKDSKLIATGELTLNKVQMSDQGLYTCRVSSFYGASSATVSVKIGFKPRFFSHEEENRDFYLDEQEHLSCVAIAIPRPKVSWQHNGKALSETSMEVDITMTETSMGRYTCIVSNKFGSISRDFNIINTGCLFKSSEEIDSPTLSYYDVRSGSESNIIQVPQGENLVITCPGEFIGYPGNIIEGTCVEGTTVKINELLVNASEIKCDITSIRPVIKSQRLPCAGRDFTEMMGVGYENGGKFVETYNICYDMSKAAPVYSTHRVGGSVSDAEAYKATKWFDNAFVPYNYDDLYDCEGQIENLSRYLRKPLNSFGNCCYAKKQLVNAQDLTPGLAQMSTYSNLNVVPHWSTCNSENWDEVEKRIRSTSELAGQELIVHTGTADAPTLFRPLFLTDKSHKRQRIPAYLWKVIQDELSESSLAVIQVNVPNLTQPEASRYIRCKDICSTTKWMKNPEWRNVNKGFTYCCKVEDFEKAFGFPAMFSPGMEKVLNDVSLVPDHSLI